MVDLMLQVVGVCRSDRSVKEAAGHQGEPEARLFYLERRMEELERRQRSTERRDLVTYPLLAAYVLFKVFNWFMNR